MSLLALMRPDDWNFPLLVHAFGAMALVGGLATALSFQAMGWRPQQPETAARLARWSFRTLLLVALPAWFVMRIGAEWIYSREGWGDAADEPAWLGIGYITADGGGLLLLIAIVLAGLATRRLGRGEGGSSGLLRASTVLVTIAVAAYVVTTWAMAGKPG